MGPANQFGLLKVQVIGIILYLFALLTPYVSLSTALPYRANPVKIADKSTKHLTVEITPNFREAQWHSDIPITHAIVQYRPYVFSQPIETPFNETKIPVTGSPPWYYTFGNLEPWTYVDVRIRLINKYGVGNVSEWYHGYTEWGGKSTVM